MSVITIQPEIQFVGDSADAYEITVADFNNMNFRDDAGVSQPINMFFSCSGGVGFGQVLLGTGLSHSMMLKLLPQQRQLGYTIRCNMSVANTPDLTSQKFAVYNQDGVGLDVSASRVAAESPMSTVYSWRSLWVLSNLIPARWTIYDLSIGVD